MTSLPRHGASGLLAACAIATFLACQTGAGPIQPDAAFTPYIPAFTAGYISARDPILVRVADDLRFTDTSHAALQRLFALQPEVQGSVHRHDGLTFEFRPAQRLEQDRTYTVSFHLGGIAEVPEGLERFRFQVTTYKQGIDARITDLQPLSTADLTWQRLILSVYTGDDATGQDLEGCFTAMQDGRALPLTWEHEPNGRHHRFTADSVLRGPTAGTVRIAWDAQRIAGKDKGSLEFTVPAIGDLALVDVSTHTDGEQYASLRFSDPLDPAQEPDGLVAILPDRGELRTAIDGNRLLLYPASRLSGSHTALVAAHLRNVNGGKLGRDLTVDLTFEELKPAVKMVGKGTILPSTDGLTMPFRAVNLHSVEVRVVRILERNVPQFLQVNELSGRRELARVGRLVSRKTVSLRTADNPDLGRWNTYHLDLSDHIKAEPGAIYRVELSFDQRHSAYPCHGPLDNAPHRERSWEQEQEDWDQVREYWYHDDHDDEYHWWYHDDEERARHNDPCSPVFYQRSHKATRNLIASDIGLIAKRGNDGSLVIATSDLRTAEPLGGVRLEVLDLQRTSMASVVSDRQGVVTVPPTRHKPFLIIATRGQQRGYLRLEDGASLPVSEFDVQGEAIDRGLKGFLYGERGVWRPGDTLHLAFILQDEQRRLPKDHPVTLELFDARGRLDQKHVRTSSVNGMYAFRCATPPDAATGLWSANVTVGGTVFHKSLRIETIKPNRLKVLLDPGGERLVKGGEHMVHLRSRWLHGAPARGLRARVTVTTSRGTPHFKGWEAYQFNDLRSWLPGEEQVVFEDLLNEQGEARFALDIETGNTAPAVVNANIVARVFEAGGDASTDFVNIPYHPYTAYAGIKVPEVRTAWGSFLTDTTYRFEACAVDAHGKPLAGRELRVQVYHMDWNWWWDGGLEGVTNYVSSPSVHLRSEETITTDARGRAQFQFRIDRPEWGRFAVRLTDPASGHSSAVQLHVDWPGYEGRAHRGDPSQAAMLTFNTDKEAYHVGDRATLTIPSPAGGRALVSLESGSRVLDAEWIELKAGETKHAFTVTPDMAPNVYAHVSVVQPHAKTANDLPIRLYGVVPVLVQDPATRLEPSIAVLDAPGARAIAEARTDVPFTVEVSEQGGRAMTYTLALVDEGLLDLTRYKTPDPWKHFYAREALGVRTWDLYDEVIGAFGRQLQRVLALGGSDEGDPVAAARAIRFKPVVHHIGPFELPRGKKARHSFTIGNYVGSVRVMVVASDGNKAYGHAERALPVRKPLMLLTTLPRTLSPGDVVDLPVTVFAMDPKVKEAEVSLGPNALLIPEGPTERSVRFSTPGDQVVTFRVRVKEAVGVAKITVKATGAGETASERTEVEVRQPNPPQTVTADAVLEPGQSWQQTPQPVGVAGTNSAYLELSTIPPVDMGRRLQDLIGYPHGCLEQTTSKAFPQLYIAKVMEMPDRMAQQMRGNVEAAIRRMNAFLRSDGTFNYWPGGDHYDNWTSIYAGHFLVEAERHGFAVPAAMKNGFLGAQRNLARNWTNVQAEGWSRSAAQLAQAYRLYVLALANHAEAGAMNRLREQAGLALQARWMLAAAYALTGRKDAANALVNGMETTVPAYSEQAFTYGSDLRDEAMIAEALLRMDDEARAGQVVKRIAQRLSGEGWYSTQSTAFGLMAVARLAERNALARGMNYALTLGGRTTERVSDRALVRVDLAAPDGKAAVAVTNKGKGPLFVRLVRTGVPLAGQEKAASSGLAMAVDYRLMDGTPIDPARIEQGTDFMAVVKLSHAGSAGALHQLALTQVFPSGWEVRNTRLEGSDAGLQQGPFTYRDVRDDRTLTYFGLPKGRTHTYTVALNAAYTGTYYLPGPHCEAMYDHTVNARAKGMVVQVVPPGGTMASK